MQACLVGLDDDAGDDKRGTAQLEEIVGGTDLIHLEDGGKDVAEPAFGVVGRSHVGRSDGELRLGQCLDVGLAVGCHRHLVELQVSRGHHILRKALRNLGLERIGSYRTVGGVIGTEVLLVAETANQDDHLLHAFDTKHDVLDFAQFDAESAQLDLMVGSTQDHHVAIGQPTGIVARAIDAFAVIGDEAFARHLVEVVVATSYATSTDVEFAHHANGQFVAVLIDDELLDIELRFAHGDQFGMGEFLVVGSHRNLGGSIAVEDACLGDAAHLGEQLVGELFATGATDSDLGDGTAEVGAGEPRLPARRCARHHVDLLTFDEGGQVERVVGLLFGSQNECLAIVERHTDVLQGGIERDGGDAEDATRIGEHTIGKDVGGMAVEIVADTFVAQHHTLRTAGRAAGVDEVGEVGGGEG